MPKLTAHRLLRTLNEATRRPAHKRRPGALPLNFAKWRAELREIRNALIKLRDKSEDEMDRLEDAWGDDIAPSENDKIETLYDRMEDAVDNIAEAINNIDRIL